MARKVYLLWRLEGSLFDYEVPCSKNDFRRWLRRDPKNLKVGIAVRPEELGSPSRFPVLVIIPRSSLAKMVEEIPQEGELIALLELKVKPNARTFPLLRDATLAKLEQMCLTYDSGLMADAIQSTPA